VLAANKWELVADRGRALAALEDRIEKSLPQVRGLAIVTLSGLTGWHVERLMPAVTQAFERWNRRVPTSRLNRWLAAAVESHPPPAVGGRRLRLRYAAQVKARPPTIAIFANHVEALPSAYLRYLANSLREAFDLPGMPIRFHLRKGENPYAES
jgi:GTP-binding protein